MNRSVRTILAVALAAVFLGSGAMLCHRALEYQKGEEVYAEAETLAEVPDFSRLETAGAEGASLETPSGETPSKSTYVDPYADALRSMDFTALREVNGDVLGWIVIPGTPISYPLVQGTDNEFYLRHTWKKTPGAVGAIFLESRSSADFGDFHTVIYGHRMNNGSMFATLKNYKKQSYWAAHPFVYITDDAGSHRYDIFAAYEASTSGQTYQIGFSNEEKRQAFLDSCMAQSVIDTGITPATGDRVVTLSTCTGNGHATRWVVQAVLRHAAAGEGGQAAEAPTQVPEEPTESTEVPAQSVEAPTESAAPPVAETALPIIAPETAPPESESAPPAADSGAGGDAGEKIDEPQKP